MSERERTRNGAPFPDRAAGIGTQKNPLWIRFGWEISCRLSFYLTQQFIRHFSRHTYLWEPSRVASTPPLRAFVSCCDGLTLPFTQKYHTADTHLSTRHPGSLGDLSLAVVMLLAKRLNALLHTSWLWRRGLASSSEKQQRPEACRFPVGASIKKEWLVSLPYFLIYSHWTLPCALCLLIQKRPSRAIKVAAPSYICIILNQNNSAFWEESSILYTTSGFL